MDFLFVFLFVIRFHADASRTAARNLAPALGYFGYAGRYEVDEAARAVRHQIELALAPNLAGSTQFRRVHMEGPRLHLRGDPVPIGARLAAHVINWERVAS